MRPTTEVWLGLRNVGERADKNGTVIHADVKTVILELAKWIAKQTMAGHFRIIFARNESECKEYLSGIKSRAAINGFDESLLDILSQGMEDTLTQSNDSSDDYVPQLGGN